MKELNRIDMTTIVGLFSALGGMNADGNTRLVLRLPDAAEAEAGNHTDDFDQPYGDYRIHLHTDDIRRSAGGDGLEIGVPGVMPRLYYDDLLKRVEELDNENGDLETKLDNAKEDLKIAQAELTASKDELAAAKEAQGKTGAADQAPDPDPDMLKVTISGTSCRVKRIDSTHCEVYSEGIERPAVYHIGQLSNLPCYEEIEAFCKQRPQPDKTIKFPTETEATEIAIEALENQDPDDDGDLTPEAAEELIDGVTAADPAAEIGEKSAIAKFYAAAPKMVAARKHFASAIADIVRHNGDGNAYLKALEQGGKFSARYQLKGYEDLCVDVLQFFGERDMVEVIVDHHYVQNGDRMADPEIRFLVLPDGKWLPYSYLQHGIDPSIGMREYYDDAGNVNVTGLRDCIQFTGQWAKNLRSQGWMKSSTKHKRTTPATSPAKPNLADHPLAQLLNR